ncbi:MAG: M20 family metallopeptidase [Treponemataceae bacterium]|nr:MAG: M20 family metallopeptidase [Treponemataceae bacterium]
MDVLTLANKFEQDVITMRRDLHRHPEPSWKETRTSGIIKKELEKLGIPFVPVGETGIVGTIAGTGSAGNGKTIALRADMDALSVQELNTDLPYCSTIPGFMHACGHDGHTASLFGAARILNELKNTFRGTVKLFFEPAEEVGGSLDTFIDAGQLDGLDGCFGLHIWADVPVGKIVVSPGPKMASTDTFRLTITGKGGHGSMPHQGVDAMVAACSVIQNLQTIVSRELSPLEPCVVTVGKLTAGQRFNAIPDTAVMEGNVRTFNPEICKNYPEIIERIASNTARAFRCEAKLEYKVFGSTPPVINPPEQAVFAEKVVKKLFGAEAVGEMQPVMGGEDFAAFMQKVPGLYAFVGAGNPSKDCVYPHHHGKFNIDEDALKTAMSLYAQYALDFLNS